MNNRIDHLNLFTQKCKKIYIYGAGMVGQKLYRYLTYNKITDIAGFIVSEKDKNAEKCCGKNIYQLSEISLGENAGVVVAIKQIPFSLKQICMDKFLRNVFFVYAEIVYELNQWEKQYLCGKYQETGQMYSLNIEENKDPSCIYLKNTDGRDLFRIYGLKDIQQFSQLNCYCNLEEFQKEYGTFKLIDYDNMAEMDVLKSNVDIYVITSHLDNMNIYGQQMEPYRKMLQVGADLTKIRKGCLLDNVGDNISEKNKEYCECTGLYWIWKNTKGQDYLGIEHYRRRMRIDGSVINQAYAKNIDILLPTPQFGFMTNYEFMTRSLVTEYDWNVVERIITEIDGTYKKTLEQYRNGYFYFSCNIGLMKRIIFDEYCSFAFLVAERLEKHYEDKNIVRKGDRFMGFIFEHLFSIFIMKNYSRLNIYCTELLWCE